MRALLLGIRYRTHAVKNFKFSKVACGLNAARTLLLLFCRFSSSALHQCPLRAAGESEGPEVFFFAGDGQVHGVARCVSGVAGRVGWRGFIAADGAAMLR